MFKRNSSLLAVLLLLVAAVGTAAEDDFIPVEDAFRYSVSSDGGNVAVKWQVAPGYYLYRDRMSVASEDPAVRLDTAEFPAGEIHEDEYFGKQTIFRGQFTVTARVLHDGDAPASLPLLLKLQGCADAGLCYPPQTWRTTVALTQAPAAGAVAASDGLSRIMSGGGGADEFLPVDDAFRILASADSADRVAIEVLIAPGYYLYRERLSVKSDSPAIHLGAMVLPKGETKEDEYFGVQEVYHDHLSIKLPVSRRAGPAVKVVLSVGFQGCAEAGLCYPPTTRDFTVELPATDQAVGASGGNGGSDAFVSEQDRLAALVQNGNFALMLATFLGLGLLLAFTPCVLPMIPILSGIIAGQGERVTAGRSFALSLTYVLGMAFTNTLAGIAAAAAGQQVQAIFQQTWIIVLFGLLFVALAVAMFGGYTLQMPAAIQSRLTAASNAQAGGTFIGTAIMGALSALIVTACVAPPLVATLAVIGQGGDVVRGGSALFAMSIGMGAPLLVVGASAGHLLPRAGAWMETVKQLFGVLMLAVAAWMFARILPERWQLLLWAVPAFALAVILLRATTRKSSTRLVARTVALAAAAYGLLLVGGAVRGATDPLAPWVARTHAQGLAFERIKTVADLDAAVRGASAAGQGVMLDFYADWCVSCKEMEKYTFTDAAVQQGLGRVRLLQADVTKNDPEDQALLKHFGIFGPPTIAFYGRDGVERKNFRVVGFMPAAEFAPLARRATSD
ncbi:MAG: protein-disulfide reductase DsbD [Steroidobacteraceae bacterium]